MSVRSEVLRFAQLGPLPPESDDAEAGDEAFGELERSRRAVRWPVSDDEARLLAQGFGVDECFGLAWTLLQLVETAPTPVPAAEPPATANEWLRLLWRRQQHPAPSL
jgi:hypothetical protein